MKYENSLSNVFANEDMDKIDIFSFGKQEHDKFDAHVVTYNGFKKLVSVNLNKTINENGKVEIYAIFTDLDEYKKNQESIKIEFEMFKKILNNLSFRKM